MLDKPAFRGVFNPSSQGSLGSAAKMMHKSAEEGVVNTLQSLYFLVLKWGNKLIHS